MKEDPRCCGTGTCIIDPEGYCWCGQQWDGEKMAMPKLVMPSDAAPQGADGQTSSLKASES